MRNIRLDLEYDGANYCGWQFQPNHPSLERTLKEAVERIINHTIVLYSSGRTDSGVHAEQHVAHFRSDTTLTHDNIIRGVNSITPRDVLIYAIHDMPLEWSARHDAREREYCYRIYNDQFPSVFWRKHSHWVREPLDLDAMREAASLLEGHHNFNAFRSLHCDADNPVRTLRRLEFFDERPLIRLRVVGEAFLRHQVRIIAGTLLDVGLGKRTPESMRDILESKDRNQAGTTLPGCGLTLVSIKYSDEIERITNIQPVAELVRRCRNLE
ncbi:MAG: tRNA pseudouridine(38-40) synthase TruA [Candidatus Hinthialibacter antarcticus]|nr:tRNA pseudouridine(38-40) synthase TruA [Candidatus Hinthialibacter antarcticus]